MEYAQQFPPQQKNREQDNKHSHQLSEGKAAAVRFEAPRGQTQDVQRGEAEYDRPQNVVDVVSAAGMTRHKHETRYQ